MSLAKRKIMPRNEPEQAAEVRPEELRLLEAIVEAFALRDLQSGAQSLVVGAKTHEPSNDRFVGAVSFPGAGERAMELDARTFGSAAHETSRQQSKTAGARGMRAGRADHDGPDDVEK